MVTLKRAIESEPVAAMVPTAATHPALPTTAATALEQSEIAQTYNTTI